MAGEDKKDKENGLVTALKQGSEDQIKSINETTTNIDNEMGTQATHLADIVTGWNDRLNESTEEAKLQQSQDRTRTAFAGVTEFANALTNLLGTTKNAKHQVQKTYTADWMQQADNHRKYYKEERQRLEQQKNAAQNDLDKLNLMREQLKASAQQQIASLQSETGVKVAQAVTEESRYQDTLNQQKTANYLKQQQTNASLAAKGIVPDGNGGYRWDKDIANGLKTTKMPRNYSPVVTGVDENGQPIVRVGDYLALGRNIKSLIDAGRVTDLDEEGQALLAKIKEDTAGDWEGHGANNNDEVAKRLTSLVTHSQMLQSEAERYTEPLSNYFNDPVSTAVAGANAGATLTMDW